MTQVMPFLFFDDLFSPLDFILSEHDCQLQVCEHIEELVEADRIERLIGEAAALVAFFADHLVLHHRDEEEDLFRLLSARCRPEDGLAGILAELEKDHTAERFLMRHIVLDLRAILSAGHRSAPRICFPICVPSPPDSVGICHGKTKW